MKRLILLCCTLTMLIMPTIGQEKPNASGADGTMYIIQVNSDGTLPTLVDGKYEGQIPLTGNEEATGVAASNVHIDYGFIFEGVSDNGTKRTFFQLLSAPLRMDAENRLVIAPNATNYIPVEEGTYDITLYQPTPGVRVFPISPSDILSGIDSTYDTTSSPAEYFDCHGHMLPTKPTAPGIYIMISGTKASKILIN